MADAFWTLPVRNYTSSSRQNKSHLLHVLRREERLRSRIAAVRSRTISATWRLMASGFNTGKPTAHAYALHRTVGFQLAVNGPIDKKRGAEVGFFILPNDFEKSSAIGSMALRVNIGRRAKLRATTTRFSQSTCSAHNVLLRRQMPRCHLAYYFVISPGGIIRRSIRERLAPVSRLGPGLARDRVHSASQERAPSCPPSELADFPA